MLKRIPYDREAAVRYAHRWAYERNPTYYNYDDLGGDCTNYASQCLYAGTGVMNFTPTFGWYNSSSNDKAPAWTGVPYFFNFMTRQERSLGPVGIESTIRRVELGDFVQFLYANKNVYGHTPIIVEIGDPPTLDNVLVAAHTQDSDWRPLSSYEVDEIRYIHILGAYAEENIGE